MELFTDLRGNVITEGDRVRVINGTDKLGFLRDDKLVPTLGWYCIVEALAEPGYVILQREGEPNTTYLGHTRTFVLAPKGEAQPEILQHPAPSGAHDVTLACRTREFSTYGIGKGEGVASLLHGTGRWQAQFRGSSEWHDAGSAAEHPDTEQGAWAAWASRHPLLAADL